MDVHFARSRRRAAARRLTPVRKPKARWNAVRGLLVLALLFGFVGETTRLEISSARSAGGSHPAKVVPLAAACGVPTAFHAAFRRAAARTGLPVSFLAATAYEESRMDPHARSGAGAQGLFQLMPETGRDLDLASDSPADNVLAGATYLKLLLKRFHGFAMVSGADAERFISDAGIQNRVSNSFEFQIEQDLGRSDRRRRSRTRARAGRGSLRGRSP